MNINFPENGRDRNPKIHFIQAGEQNHSTVQNNIRFLLD